MTTPTTPTPREEARSWSPARAHDDDRGPRCGAENEGLSCERERGHEGQHFVHENGFSFFWGDNAASRQEHRP